METNSTKLIHELRHAGLSESAIRAAWPSWWTDEAETSISAQAELRFALSRSLGVSPRSLLGERVEFVWSDEARFKSLAPGVGKERAILTSFGMAIGRSLIRATRSEVQTPVFSGLEARTAILASRRYVDLAGLLTFCWALGIPVVHLRIFPLAAKLMHAMVVKDQGRYAILLGRNANYPEQVAFTLSHEVGHIAMSHIAGSSALVDMDESTKGSDDVEEQEADAFALEVLTGSKKPEITTNVRDFSAKSLAASVLEVGPARGIDPGTLALCLAHQQNLWPVAMAALRQLHPETRSIWADINNLAMNQMDASLLTNGEQEYLQKVLFSE